MQSRLPKLAGLGSRYQLLATLASGGMGKVHLARALGDTGARTVAIKVLHPHLAEDPEVVAMFLDEARLATRIHHPNVVEVHDLDLVGDDLVIVMEYIDGVPLHQIQRALHGRGTEMPISFALSVVCDALAGLHAAHELEDDLRNPLGVVHRDVSPQNILVGVDGAARVTDFGIATSTGRLALTRPDGPVKGKLQYLAPEQIQRKKAADRRVDVFASGIVLWECLTGRTLFGGGTEAETLAMVLSEPIPPPSSYRADVPAAIDDICLRALERDAARRFATAADFRAALIDAAGELLPSADVGALVADLASDALRRNRAAIESPAPVSRARTEEDSLTHVIRRPRRAGVGKATLLLAILGAIGVATVIGLIARTAKTSAESSVVVVPTSPGLASRESSADAGDGLDVVAPDRAGDPISVERDAGPIGTAAGARAAPRRAVKRADPKVPFMPGHL